MIKDLLWLQCPWSLRSETLKIWGWLSHPMIFCQKQSVRSLSLCIVVSDCPRILRLLDKNSFKDILAEIFNKKFYLVTNGKIKNGALFARFWMHFFHQICNFLQRGIHPSIDLKLVWWRLISTEIIGTMMVSYYFCLHFAYLFILFILFIFSLSSTFGGKNSEQ